MNSHPVCPRCGLPALRLVLANQACDWCRDQHTVNGKPYTRRNWKKTLARLDERITALNEAATTSPTERQLQPPKPMCRRGLHPMTPENAVVRRKAGRDYWTCRECQNHGNRAARARKKDAA